MTFEWTELTYQEILAGNTMLLIFPLCVLLVYLVLAAQYESWSLPLTVILIVPMTLFSAIAGVWLTGGDNNVFTQISFLVLAGLACKNAILIVEFAEAAGRRRPVGASRRSWRVPRPAAPDADDVDRLHHGRGAARVLLRRRLRDPQAMGIAVFAGMLGVTLFGLFLTPVFYIVIGRLTRRAAHTAHRPRSPVPVAGGRTLIMTRRSRAVWLKPDRCVRSVMTALAVLRRVRRAPALCRAGGRSCRAAQRRSGAVTEAVVRPAVVGAIRRPGARRPRGPGAGGQSRRADRRGARRPGARHLRRRRARSVSRVTAGATVDHRDEAVPGLLRMSPDG